MLMRRPINECAIICLGKRFVPGDDGGCRVHDILEDSRELAGISLITELIQQAGNRIEIVLGGGIQIGNVQRLLRQLPLEIGSLSIHAYSGVLQNGVINLEMVQQLITAVADRNEIKD